MGTPRGVLDRTWRGDEVGCEDLREALGRVQPPLFVCGHIHEAMANRRLGATRCVNASICDVREKPIHLPIVVDR
jgi:Icc-related predicted phosphoesterase